MSTKHSNWAFEINCLEKTLWHLGQEINGSVTLLAVSISYWNFSLLCKKYVKEPIWPAHFKQIRFFPKSVLVRINSWDLHLGHCMVYCGYRGFALTLLETSHNKAVLSRRPRFMRQEMCRRSPRYARPKKRPVCRASMTLGERGRSGPPKQCGCA